MGPRGYSTITRDKGLFQEWGTEKNVRDTPSKLSSCPVSTSEYLNGLGECTHTLLGPFRTLGNYRKRRWLRAWGSGWVSAQPPICLSSVISMSYWPLHLLFLLSRIEIMKDLHFRVVCGVGSVTCGNVRRNPEKIIPKVFSFPPPRHLFCLYWGLVFPSPLLVKGSQDSGSPRFKGQTAKAIG